MKALSELTVKIFADGADLAGMLDMYRNPLIKGFTTNPTLMRKAGVVNYETFAREVLRAIPDRPVSIEVLSDEFNEMERQARTIASWAQNVYVKIPITNTRGGLVARPGAPIGARRSEIECHCVDVARSSARGERGSRRRTAIVHFCFRRADRRYWARARATDGSRRRIAQSVPQSRIDLGKPA